MMKIKYMIFGIILTLVISFVTIKTTYCFMTVGEELEVSFDTMGGEQIQNIVYNYGVNTLTNKLPTPEKEGYTFDGWYLEKEYNTKINDVPYPNFNNNKIVTLYAKWSLGNDEKKYYILPGIIILFIIALLVIVTKKKKQVKR